MFILLRENTQNYKIESMEKNCYSFLNLWLEIFVYMSKFENIFVFCSACQINFVSKICAAKTV